MLPSPTLERKERVSSDANCGPEEVGHTPSVTSSFPERS